MSRKKVFFLMLIVGSVFFLSQCVETDKDHDPRGKVYAGSASCLTCHRAIAESYTHTAHFHSASPASLSTIGGRFSKDSNTFTVNDSMKVVMEVRDAVPYQVLYVHGKQKRAERFDIVFGSAKGQSYLYWKGDLIFQLPISYFTSLHSWTGSPGFPVDQVIFDRPIYQRCFECHSSYIKEATDQVSGREQAEALDKNTAIYNIDCERCHGPAASHVNFHTENPGLKEGRYIVSYKSLSREQKMDMCAVCHSGNKNFMLGSTFGFRPGDTLARFMLPRMGNTPNAGQPDVHGNQIRLLASSRCFMGSTMDCSTCHDTHANDRGNFAQYAQHCQSCHAEGGDHFCKMADSSNIAFLRNNCSKCHMPEQRSNIIIVKTSTGGVNTAISMINHRIAVYPEEAKKIIAEMKQEEHYK
jgi:Cytochrome c554 and c-prime